MADCTQCTRPRLGPTIVDFVHGSLPPEFGSDRCTTERRQQIKHARVFVPLPFERHHSRRTRRRASLGGLTPSALPVFSTAMAGIALSHARGRAGLRVCPSASIEGKYPLPVALHIGDDPTAFWCFVERALETTDVRAAIVGPFSLGIGVMHDEAERRRLP